MPTGGAIIGSAAIGGVTSLFGGKAGASSARSAARLQLQGTREAIAAAESGAERGFDIFQREAERARSFLREQNELARQELAPLREIGLRNLERASAFADPDSAESQRERDVFQRNLRRTLAARGLTASGTEIAGLGDFEVGLARERRNIALGLAGQGANTLTSLAGLQSGLGAQLASTATNLGATGSSLFANLGTNTGNLLQQNAANLGNLEIQRGQALQAGLTGFQNALQAGAGGLIGLQQNRGQAASQEAFNQQLLNILRSNRQTAQQNPTSGSGIIDLGFDFA